MTDILGTINTRKTLPMVQARPDQVRNAAGGWVFPVTPLVQLERFLILGSLDGNCYVYAQKLTQENADRLMQLVRDNPSLVVEKIVQFSLAGRPLKQDFVIFALAVAASAPLKGNPADPHSARDRKMALDALPVVIRTGTQMFMFQKRVRQFRGYGRGLRRAIAAWYLDKNIEDVAFQTIKYRSRRV